MEEINNGGVVNKLLYMDRLIFIFIIIIIKLVLYYRFIFMIKY